MSEVERDTLPTIAPEVLERFRRDSECPKATEDDVRRAILDNIPDLVLCPACGNGKTSPEHASYVQEALDALDPEPPPTRDDIPIVASEPPEAA